MRILWSATLTLGAVIGLVLYSTPLQAQPTGAVQSAWVEWTGAGAQVRAVADGDRCPTLSVDDRARPMTLRAGPESGFTQTICQFDLPQDARRAVLDGRALPIPSPRPQRIVIFGDTGCRLKGETIQNCGDPRAWPFALLVRHAAAQRPDLVIHVGDYYYRERPCPAGLAGCAGSPYGDQWATWRAEFFDPAAPLLAQAPWVFVRGNHETCSRGGRGWFRLLDAASSPRACGAAGSTVSAPFRVDLGDLSLYVLDSADAVDVSAPPAAVDAFKAQLDQLEPDLARRPGWILTHRPIWGLAPVLKLGPLGPVEAALNRTEQVAVRTRDLGAVRMVVSGHVHHFAGFSFGPARPAQLIVGAGGDLGEPADTSALRAVDRVIDGMEARGLSFERFGYLILERAGDDWMGTFRDLDDRITARCRLHGRALTCNSSDKLP